MNKHLKIDMHVHSRWSSDGLISESDLIAACRKKGLNGVAITDHNTIKGALAVKKIAPSDFVVVVGEEIRTVEGEVMGYFLKKEIPPQLSVQETLERIKAQGGLAAIPHPFCRFRKSRLEKSAIERIKDTIDLVEVFNSRNIFAKDDEKAFILSQKYGLTPVVGSDAHLKCELGRAKVEIEEFNNAKEFLENLRFARFFYQRSGLWVHFVTKWIKLIRNVSFPKLSDK